MELEKLIAGRRALYPKQMSGDEVPTEVIDKMLELANWAPTHRNTEPWRFNVYSGAAKNRLLDQCKNCYVVETPAEKFKTIKLDKIEERKHQVSHIVAICMQRSDIIPEFEEIAATAMAVQNIWLYLASTRKYGGYWSTSAYALGEEFSAFLHLPEGEKCLGLFYIGTIALDTVLPEGKRGEWRKKVRFEK
ncbi:nitroreductase [Bacteroidia bacterium]|nr:nitroreductase [Bacteroidia bacterium]MDB9882069.1 nitroreductase [Bacteroidia bacterium]